MTREQTQLDRFEVDYVSDFELSQPQILEIEKAISLYLEPGLKFIFNRKNVLERSKRGKLKQFESLLPATKNIDFFNPRDHFNY